MTPKEFRYLRDKFMEKMTRPAKVQKIPKKQMDRLDLTPFDFEGNLIPQPQNTKRELEWNNDKAILKKGRIKVLRNKRQTKYSVEGLTKTEFNKVKDLL